MSEYINTFIKDHKEYFQRNKTIIESNVWNNTELYNSRMNSFTEAILNIQNGKENDKEKKEKIKDIQQNIKDLLKNTVKNKVALFKQENKLVRSILGRLEAFIQETEKNGERKEYRDKAQTFIEDTVDIINIHLNKCSEYLKYGSSIINKEAETEEEIEYNDLEIDFQDDIFIRKVEIQNKLKDLNISGEVSSTNIEFYNKKKASFVLREPLCLLRDDVKEITEKIPVNWDIRTSKEMFINMRPQDIPKWNNSKHYFEQDPVVLSFWAEEYNKIINGINLGGFYMHGWLYFHLNFFRTPIPQPDGREPNIQPPLRDNEWFFAENLKACESKDYPGYYSKAMLVYGTRRFAKALRDDQDLHYTDGSVRPIGLAKEGDEIFGSDGKPTTIVGVYPQGEVDLYEVEMADGRKSICCDEHLWTVYDYQAKKYKVLPLKELMREGWSYNRKRVIDKKEGESTIYKYFIPINKEVDYDFNVKLPIDPYFLGLWLGDGSSNLTAITTIDSEVENYICNYANSIALTVRKESKVGTEAKTLYLKNRKGADNHLFSTMREMKLINNKHIPDSYFYSSIEDRMELLRGLMDTDGTINKGGSDISFTSASKILSNDFLRLVRSLGIHARITHHTGNYVKKDGELNTYYKVVMYTDKKVFNLERKLKRIDKNNVNRNGKIERTAIVDIRRIDRAKATCIRVNNESREFLTNDFIVTHNSVILASLAHWRTISKFNSFGSIIGGNSSDLNALTSKVKTSMTYIDNPLKLDILKQEWENGETTFGIKNDASNPIIFSTLIVQNLEQGTTKKTQKTAGLAPSVSIYDEIGKYDFLKPYLAALPSFKTPYGFKCVTCLAGTGGEASLSKDAMKVLSNPESYDLLPMDYDLLEKNIDPEHITWRRKKFATFFPGQMAYEEGFIKEEQSFGKFIKNDNEELIKTKIYVTNWAKNTKLLEDKIKEAEKAKDSALLVQQRRVQYPTDPEHCFLSAEKNPFCYQDAVRHKEYLDLTGKWDRRRALYRDQESGKIKSEISSMPLIEYPYSGGNQEAPFLIFEDIPEETPPMYTYIAGLDDYKQVTSNTDSVGTIYIYKFDLFGDKFAKKLVASYSARPDKHKTFHKNCLLLLEAYNATCFMENEDTGFIEFLEEMHLEDKYLARAVDFTSSLNITNNAPRKFGWSPKQSKSKLLNMFVNYCNADIDSINEQGEEIKVKGITRIDDIHLLTEVINYKEDGNFDRISASLGAIGWLHYLETNFMHPIIKKKEKEEDIQRKQFTRSLLGSSRKRARL